MPGAGTHTPDTTGQVIAGGQYGNDRRRRAADPRVAPCSISVERRAVAPAISLWGAEIEHKGTVPFHASPSVRRAGVPTACPKPASTRVWPLPAPSASAALRLRDRRP